MNPASDQIGILNLHFKIDGENIIFELSWRIILKYNYFKIYFWMLPLVAITL